MKNQKTEFYTIKQAAAKLEVSAATLRGYLSKGKIRGYKKFQRWYIFETDLIEFLQSE